MEIARQIETHDAVLVQGPPGTGKTHTIANLMGHFLAQGKSILVTSNRQKALQVLKSQLPEQLQNLCVAVLDDSRKDMESSIDGITEYTSGHTQEEVARAAEEDRQKRAEIIEQLAKVRKKIFQMQTMEYKPFVFAGQNIMPIEAARFLAEHKNELDDIPGQIAQGKLLPLSFEELTKLYQTNVTITAEEEKELLTELPSPTSLASPMDGKKWFLDVEARKREIFAEANKLGLEVVFTKDGLDLVSKDKANRQFHLLGVVQEKAEALLQYLQDFGEIEDWQTAAVIDGKQGGAVKERWQMLCDSILSLQDFSNQNSNKLFGKQIEFSTVADFPLKETIEKMRELYATEGKISRLKRLFHKEYQKVEDIVKINAHPIKSVEDCEVVLIYLEHKERMQICGSYWQNLMKENDVPSFDKLNDGKEPEIFAAQNIVPQIQRMLDWCDHDFEQLRNLLKECGIEPDTIFTYSSFETMNARLKSIMHSIAKEIPALARIQLAESKLCVVQNKIHAMEEKLIETSIDGSEICCQLRDAWQNADVEGYAKTYHTLEELYRKYDMQHMRQEYLARLYAVAPIWAANIQRRSGVYGQETVPENIFEAWRCKQYWQFIEDLQKNLLDELEEKSHFLSSKYRKSTAKLAEDMAWLHLLALTNEDPRLMQNLRTWKGVTKQLGRGTGKQAPLYRAQAKKLMAECQKAVPAWIMPLGTVMNQLEPGKNHFVGMEASPFLYILLDWLV